MAKRPKRENKNSTMYEDPELEIIKEPQCLGCVHNKGLKCDAFGNKPMKYADGMSTEKCPERKAE